MRSHAYRLGRLIGIAVLIAITSGGIAAAQVEADRVTLRYNAGSFELLAVTPLTTVLPETDALPGAAGEVSGFWVELQDASGAVLYRRVVGDPVRWVYEGPETVTTRVMAAKEHAGTERQRPRGELSPLPAQLGSEPAPVDRTRTQTKGVRASQMPGALHFPERSEAVPSERTFSVLVPRAAAGDELVLFSSPIDVGTEAEAATEMARIELAPSNP